jgi:hypothetical protein
MIYVNCEKCGIEYETKSYYKVDHRGLDERKTYYVTFCTGCSARIETEQAPQRGLVAYGQTPEKATQRIPGTNNFWPGRARWDGAPADLARILEEERMLREKNNKREDENGEEKI